MISCLLHFPQVFNKLLTLASGAVQSGDSTQQINMMLSTEGVSFDVHVHE